MNIDILYSLYSVEWHIECYFFLEGCSLPTRLDSQFQNNDEH